MKDGGNRITTELILPSLLSLPSFISFPFRPLAPCPYPPLVAGQHRGAGMFGNLRRH